MEKRRPVGTDTGPDLGGGGVVPASYLIYEYITVAGQRAFFLGIVQWKCAVNAGNELANQRARIFSEGKSANCIYEKRAKIVSDKQTLGIHTYMYVLLVYVWHVYILLFLYVCNMHGGKNKVIIAAENMSVDNYVLCWYARLQSDRRRKHGGGWWLCRNACLLRDRCRKYLGGKYIHWHARLQKDRCRKYVGGQWLSIRRISVSAWNSYNVK